MNKYEESCRLIKREVLISCPETKDGESCNCEKTKQCIYKNALDNIEELVKRATPENVCFGDDEDYAYCNNCNEEFKYEKWGDDYCPNCGQALEWRKAE